MSDEKGTRTVGVSDMPRTIKGYQWFEQVAGRSITIEGVSLLGNNKGATRYGALVVCKSRDHAKDFVKKVKDHNSGPRAKVLNSDKEVETFRTEIVKNRGWSKDAPDGDKGITVNTGVDIRGDASGFSHGFNPYKKSRSRSDGRRRSRSPKRRRSPSPRPAKRGGSRSRSRKDASPPPRKKERRPASERRGGSERRGASERRGGGGAPGARGSSERREAPGRGRRSGSRSRRPRSVSSSSGSRS